MKVSANWLQEYLSKKLTAAEMATALETVGVELEQISSSKNYDKNLVVGLVKKVVQHPNADKLRLAKVDNGKKLLDIVCGAPNLEAGQKVVLAQVGTKLPDGLEIKPALIRGEKSDGMICSAAELGISDDHSGILVLPDDYKLGERLCDLWPSDTIIEVSTHANRPDLQSVIGLAREVAAIVPCEVKLPKRVDLPENGEELKVQIDESEKVPRYLALKLELGKLKPTPEWMRARLTASGVRPISPIVDVTNYVMLEYGQPLHAFDAAKVKLPIRVTRAAKGENLVTLDGIKRVLVATDLVIADKTGPIAIAGVMGGQNSEVSESTKSIILESATFDGVSVRRTAARQKLRSEASARFERGLPVQLAPLALARAAELLKEIAGAKPSSKLSDNLQVWPWVQHIGVRASRVAKILGIEVSPELIAEKLRQLGFEAEPFDITAEAKKHLNKPYKFGARFRTDGTGAFDCSYLIDYIYSLIGQSVGHTALQQYESGKPVHTGELLPGDVLFRGGPWVKLKPEERKGVSHDAIYVGSGQIVHARDYVRGSDGKWEQLPEAERKVMVEPIESILDDPQYLGARRYAENLPDYVAVTSPWWRPDLKTEEDVIEEVGRLIGYDNVPARLPAWRPPTVRIDRRWPKIWQTRALMKGIGLFEVQTYSFVSGATLREFGYDLSKHLKLKNPLSSEQEYLRSDLLPSLLGVVAKNQGYSKEFGIYELSKVYKAKAAPALPDEPTHLGAILRAGYIGIKAILDCLNAEFHLALEVRPQKQPFLHPARAGEVWAGSVKLGRLGEVHPDLVAQSKITGQVSYLELDFDKLIGLAREPKYHEISRYPEITRDIAVVVKDEVSWAKVSELIERSKLATPQFLSDYYGSDLDKGHKSLAVRLHMLAMDRTLTDSEADKRQAEILKLLERQFGAKVR